MGRVQGDVPIERRDLFEVCVIKSKGFVDAMLLVEGTITYSTTAKEADAMLGRLRM